MDKVLVAAWAARRSSERYTTVRVAFAAVAVLASSVAAARFNCVQHSPSMSEIDDILAAGAPTIPHNARLQRACYEVVQQHARPPNPQTIRYSYYEFAWPTVQKFGGVRFFESARCARPTGETPCPFGKAA